MNKIYLVLIVLFILPLANALTVEEGTIFIPEDTNITYIAGINLTVETMNVTNDTLYINNFQLQFLTTTPNSLFNYTITAFTSDSMTLTSIATSTVNATEIIKANIRYQNSSYPIYLSIDGVTLGNIANSTATATITYNATHTYLINLSPALSITFADTTTGIVVTETGSKLFNLTQLNDIKPSLGNGTVKIMFNMVNNTNWTQYYEFKNNVSESVNDTMGILTKADVLMYFTIQDYDNSPIDNAIIRVYQVTPTYNWTSYEFFGQRLTPDSGTTFFFFDSNTQVLMTIQKDGYALKTVLLTIADQENHATSATAYPIYMDKSTVNTLNGISYNIQNYYCDNASTLFYSLYAPSYSYLYYNTTYHPAWTATSKNAIDVYSGYLVNGTDYVTSSTSFVVDWIYENETIVSNTIQKSTHCSYELINTTGLAQATGTNLNPMYFIALILVSGLLSMMFKEQKLGFHTFMIGGMMLTLTSPVFIPVAIINGAYYLLRAIHIQVKA